MGGASDDILIAGTTFYDTNETALMAILKEWQRTDPSYAQRKAALSVGNNMLVWGMTVFDNDAPGANCWAEGEWIGSSPSPMTIKDAARSLLPVVRNQSAMTIKDDESPWSVARGPQSLAS